MAVMHLKNVFPVHPQWATKILSGSKTIEVRKRAIEAGVYGIAVCGIPDLVFGIVCVERCSASMASEDIEKLRGETCIADADLRRYLHGCDGYCWFLKSPEVFVQPVHFFSNGQTFKGCPRHKHQLDAETLMFTAERLSEPKVDELASMFTLWHKRQAESKEQRAETKLQLFGHTSKSCLTRQAEIKECRRI